jgi:hypothetical protein
LFRDRPKDGDHGILENSARVEIWFRKRSESNAVTAEPVEVLQGFQRTLSSQPVKRPENEDIEAPLGSIGHHGLKLSPIGLAARIVVFVLADDGPALSLAKFSELGGLVGGFLTFVFG